MRSGRPRGAREGLARLSRPPGPARPQKRTQQKKRPDCFQVPKQNKRWPLICEIKVLPLQSSEPSHDASGRECDRASASNMLQASADVTLCYAIVFPGHKSAFRSGFWPGCYRESIEIGPPAGRRTDFGFFPVAFRPKSGPEGRFPARKHYCVT